MRLQGEKLAEILAFLQVLENEQLLPRSQRRDIWPAERIDTEEALNYVDEEYRVVVRRLIDEADWALLGARTALNRLRALAAGLDGQLEKNDLLPDAASMFEERAGVSLDEEQLLKYRAHLALATVSECFFWLHACWDRLGIALVVAAFRRRQTRKHGWGRAWSELKDEFGDVELVVHSDAWRLAGVHHAEGFKRINARRNGLTHRASVTGMQAGADDPLEAALLARFLYDERAWESLELPRLVEDLGNLTDVTNAARLNAPRLLRVLLEARR